MKKAAVVMMMGLSLVWTSSASAGPTYNPVGPQTNVLISAVLAGGWTQCYSAPYGQFGPTVVSAVSGFTGDLMMLAGAANGSSDLSVLAWAPTVDVMFNTGFSDTPHDANGSGWYFSDNFSWGFAPAGAPISRGSCDYRASTSITGVDATTAKRLCWHTRAGSMTGGWRVGAVDDLYLEPSGYTKYIFTANSAANNVPEPETMTLLGQGILAGTLARRRRKA